jgi:hypothetical protein
MMVQPAVLQDRCASGARTRRRSTTARRYPSTHRLPIIARRIRRNTYSDRLAPPEVPLYWNAWAGAGRAVVTGTPTSKSRLRCATESRYQVNVIGTTWAVWTRVQTRTAGIRISMGTRTRQPRDEEKMASRSAGGGAVRLEGLFLCGK